MRFASERERSISDVDTSLPPRVTAPGLPRPRELRIATNALSSDLAPVNDNVREFERVDGLTVEDRRRR